MAKRKSKGTPPSREELLLATAQARVEAWSRWGTVADDVLTHAINPSFMGGPRWPAMRQAYRVVRKGDVVVVASDGLSDPYDEDEGPQDENGIGAELFAATDALTHTESVMSVGGTWLHDLVFQMSQNAAARPDLVELLDELGLVTMELWDVNIPEDAAPRFVNEAGRVTILLSAGCHPIPTRIEGPLSPIRLVHIQLLTVDELRFVIEGGPDARSELAARLRAQKVAPLSRLDRPSVA